MVFKQLGKYPNDLLDEMILNCNNELTNSFKAKHRRIYMEVGNCQDSFELCNFQRHKGAEVCKFKVE